MSEKARGALFSVLGDLAGLTVLDAFAGTGALSYEAVSRGAKSVQAIELDKAAQKAIQANLQDLNLSDKINLFSGSCLRWSARFSERLFDIVMCDPPYDRILMRDIQKMSRHVRPAGLLVLSWPGHLKVENVESFELLKIKPLGDIQLVFYRRIS